MRGDLSIPSLRHIIAKRCGLRSFHQRYYPQDGLFQIFAEGYRGTNIGNCMMHRVGKAGLMLLDYVEVLYPWRRKKIGSRLLELAILRSRELGSKVISGYIVQKGLDDFPGLLRWYESFGFREVPLVNVRNQNAVLGMELRF